MCIPISLDRDTGFLLLFHLENVSFANNTLAEAKVKTCLFFSLVQSLLFGHSSRYEYFFREKNVHTNTHNMKPIIKY